MSRNVEIIHTPLDSDAPNAMLEIFCGLTFRAWDPCSITVLHHSVVTGTFLGKIEANNPAYIVVDAKDVFAALRNRDKEIASFWENGAVKPRVFVFERRICRIL